MADRHPVEKADLRVTEAVADARHDPLVRAAGWISEVADQPPLRALTGGAIVLGLALGDRRMARAGARALLAHSLATWAKGAIKARVDRTRPDHALERGYHADADGGTDEHELSSFPSGHTAGALAVSQAVARDYPGTRAGGVAFAAAVAAIQVPRAKHFVSDVAAGALIGWAAEWAASRIVDAVSAIVEADADPVARRPAAAHHLVPQPALP